VDYLIRFAGLAMKAGTDDLSIKNKYQKRNHQNNIGISTYTSTYHLRAVEGYHHRHGLRAQIDPNQT